jgi:citrate lyase subunit beta / citryl-CoA lyase
MTGSPLLRSFLYVPGNRIDRVPKALAAGSDAILIDLEDSVAASVKDAARHATVASLRRRTVGGPAVWIRINSGECGRLDAAALATEAGQLDGIVLAKCDTTDWIDEIASMIPASVPLSPLIESALGLRRLDALCAHHRVTQCHLGEIDLLADLGAHANSGSELLGYARVELLYASTAASIFPPVGGVYADTRDIEGLTADSTRLAQLGFAGRPALHPSQVPTINAVFSPSADALCAARELVAKYDDALARGIGAVTDEQGRMVDEAVVRHARQLLAGAGPSAIGPYSDRRYEAVEEDVASGLETT